MNNQTEEASSFSQFFSENYKKVLGYLIKHCSSLHDAEDIASESFFYCSKNWDSFDPQKSSRSSWLYMIVKSRLKNHYRDTKKTENLDDFSNIIPDKDVIDQSVWVTSLRSDLAEALNQLSEQQKKAVICRYFGNMSDQETALALQTTPMNVRVLVHRALKRLEQIMPSEYI